MTGWMGRAWSWRSRLNATLVLLICSGLVAFLGVAVVSNYKAANNAVDSLNRARELTSRRIDLLNHEIDRLSTQNAQAARQRGRLLTEVRALTRQLHALGVTPVVTPPRAAPGPTTVTVRPRPQSTVTAHPRPTVTRTDRPPPRPTHQPTHRPTPTPTRSRLCLLLKICLPK